MLCHQISGSFGKCGIKGLGSFGLPFCFSGSISEASERKYCGESLPFESRLVRQRSCRCRGCGSSSFDRGHTAICTGASHGFLAVFTGRAPRHASAAPGARRPPRDMLQARHARPVPKVIGTLGPGGGGGSPKALGSHRGVRMGPGVSPVGGCMFGHRGRPVLAGGLVCEIL